MRSLQSSYDVLVIGSGASGLTAALAASSEGASVAVLEKGRKFGGSSALSGGQLWIPNNDFQKSRGIVDSGELAKRYLTRLARGRVKQSLIDSFVENAPVALDFVLERTPLRPNMRESEPDYHPEWDGALKGGRTLDPGLFDGQSLGEEYANLLHNPQYHLRGGLHTTSLEFEMMMRGEGVPAMEGRKPSVVALGEALVGALRKGLIVEGVPLFLSHRAVRIRMHDGRAGGVEVSTSRGKKLVTARKGVVLAAGGFEWNQSMKAMFLSAPSENSAGCETNTGDGIMLGIHSEAAVSLMDEAWWFTLILVPGETRGRLATSERTLPGSIMVNSKGERFANEAMNYNDLTRAMLSPDPNSYSFQNIPAYLIFDSGYFSKYPVAGKAEGKTAAWLAAGNDLVALAKKLGINPTGLVKTVDEFNVYAERGIDPKFHRGESYYDRHWGDPSAKHPTLGALKKPPYYGVRMLAGDIGTKGGVVTDRFGRAIGLPGKPIPGLYAAGNNAASVMGPGYAGSGATLGPGITFGYLAGKAAASGG